MSIISSNNNDEREETANIFKVDHSIRGTAKCKECKKQISKNELRIGKMVRFKEKQFLSFSHVKCAFASFERARIASNVISDVSQLDGFEKLNPVDRNVIEEFIRAGNTGRKNPLPVSSQKKKSSQQNSSPGTLASKALELGAKEV